MHLPNGVVEIPEYTERTMCAGARMREPAAMIRPAADSCNTLRARNEGKHSLRYRIGIRSRFQTGQGLGPAAIASEAGRGNSRRTTGLVITPGVM